MIDELDRRSREIFSLIVESYLDSGDPLGSRTLSQKLTEPLSAASVRNVMSDLEQLGLLYSPHTSAGRLPTDRGLRIFVDGILEVGNLGPEEKQAIEAKVKSNAGSFEDTLAEATSLLSGLSHCAGLVTAPKDDAALKHIEFVAIGPGQALVVIVSQEGHVENRVIEVPQGLPPSALTEASNYLNARIKGNTLAQIDALISGELEFMRAELDELTARVVEAGMASWGGGDGDINRSLIVRGRANLLEDVTADDDLERIKLLFDDLESKQDMLQLLNSANGADGVRIFIGSENKLFSMSGSSLIVAPYVNANQKIVGAVGVIGPTRVNYARIIPMVDYTAQAIGRLLS